MLGWFFWSLDFQNPFYQGLLQVCAAALVALRSIFQIHEVFLYLILHLTQGQQYTLKVCGVQDEDGHFLHLLLKPYVFQSSAVRAQSFAHLVPTSKPCLLAYVHVGLSGVCKTYPVHDEVSPWVIHFPFSSSTELVSFGHSMNVPVFCTS